MSWLDHGYPPRLTPDRWRLVRERALLRSGRLSPTNPSCRASAVPTARVHADPRARRNIPGRSADALSDIGVAQEDMSAAERPAGNHHQGEAVAFREQISQAKPDASARPASTHWRQC